MREAVGLKILGPLKVNEFGTVKSGSYVGKI
jgi:hypothetical protein